jgi:hypothetical protein
MGDRLQTGEPYKGLAGAAVSPVCHRFIYLQVELQKKKKKVELQVC